MMYNAPELPVHGVVGCLELVLAPRAPAASKHPAWVPSHLQTILDPPPLSSLASNTLTSRQLSTTLPQQPQHSRDTLKDAFFFASRYSLYQNASIQYTTIAQHGSQVLRRRQLQDVGSTTPPYPPKPRGARERARRLIGPHIGMAPRSPSRPSSRTSTRLNWTPTLVCHCFCLC